MLLDLEQIYGISSYKDSITQLLSERELDYIYPLYKKKIRQLIGRLRNRLSDDPAPLKREINVKLYAIKRDHKYSRWKKTAITPKQFVIKFDKIYGWKLKDFESKKEARKKLTFDTHDGGYMIWSEEFPSLYFLEQFLDFEKKEEINPWLLDAVILSQSKLSEKQVIHSAFASSYLADPFLITFESILDKSFREIDKNVSSDLFKYQFKLLLS